MHGLSEAAARRIVAARLARGGTEGPWRAFRDVADLCHRAELDAREAGLLAEAGALRALTVHRHAAHWAVAGVEEPTPLFAQSPQEQTVDLPLPSVAQELLADYRSQGATNRNTRGPWRPALRQNSSLQGC